MSLLNTPPLDPIAEQRAARRARILKWVGIAVVVLIVTAPPLLWFYWNWPEERVVDKFLSAVEREDYKTAFALWNADPEWEQHVERYKEYTFGQFQLDWGPGGEWGKITQHKIEGSVTPRSKLTKATGVVVAARINGRGDPACLWVESRTKVISFSPIPCRF
ncbi:MAG: hypothetical protein HYX26_01410 [Acidobacteriales bacterium]|nr:hypothetical protein [Terriglobales bacterium]